MRSVTLLYFSRVVQRYLKEVTRSKSGVEIEEIQYAVIAVAVKSVFGIADE